MDKLETLWHSTGIYHMQWGQAIMILVGFGLLFLAVRKKFEPLLLVPIGFGGILANIPVAGLAESAVSQALHLGAPELVASMAGLLDMAPDATASALYAA